MGSEMCIRDRDQTSKTHQRIELNKKKVDASLAILDKLVDSVEGKALLAKVREARASYAESFGRVDKLLGEGRREEAIQTLTSETLPRLCA